MADTSQLIIDGSINAPAVVLYLGDLILRGVTSGIGKDLWDQIKKKVSSKREQDIVKVFEETPTSTRASAKVETILEGWIDSDPSFNNVLLELLNQINDKSGDNLLTISNSKNVVNSSTITTQTGNIHIGDK